MLTISGRRRAANAVFYERIPYGNCNSHTKSIYHIGPAELKGYSKVHITRMRYVDGCKTMPGRRVSGKHYTYVILYLEVTGVNLDRSCRCAEVNIGFVRFHCTNTSHISSYGPEGDIDMNFSLTIIDIKIVFYPGFH